MSSHGRTRGNIVCLVYKKNSSHTIYTILFSINYRFLGISTPCLYNSPILWPILKIDYQACSILLVGEFVLLWLVLLSLKIVPWEQAIFFAEAVV